MAETLSEEIMRVQSYLEEDIGTPERRLVAAVLIRAIQDAISKTSGILPTERRQARAFIGLSSDFPNLSKGGWGFSFVECCEELDIDPHELHGKLRQLMARTDSGSVIREIFGRKYETRG